MNTRTSIDQAEAAGFEAPNVDLDNVMSGQSFQAIWGFKNIGTTAWNTDYKFCYSGTPHTETQNDPHSVMAPFRAYTLGELGVAARIPPGDTVHLSLTLTVPTMLGAHATTWQLQTPDGRSFGPLRWMRAIVTEKVAVSEPQLPDVSPPASWRAVIWRITSVFESGVPDGRADAYQNADAGIVSFGKHQATLQSGNLEKVLDAYHRRSSSPASQALQQEFAQRVRQKEETLRHDARFKELLLEAAQESAMSEAQDEIFAERFYRPVVVEARKLGVHSPLGLACLYDTRIQGGLEAVVTAVSQKLNVQKVGDTGPTGPVDEPTWLRTFLDEREARLNRLADKREAENKPIDAEWLRTSTFRVAELRTLLAAGNLDLAGEFTVRGQLIRGHVKGRERPEPTEPAEVKSAPDSLALLDRYNGPPVKFAAGLHGPGDAHTWHDAGFRNMLKKLNMPLKFMSDGDRFRWYADFHKPHLNLVRAFWKPDPNRRKSAQQAWDEDIRDGVMNFYKAGARNFEVHNEPRLPHEGMGHQWQNGAEFGDFLRELMLIIKQHCPEARLWYPGESPGVPWTDQFAFTWPAYKKVSDLCDGICQHAYSGNTVDVETAVKEIVDQVQGFHKAMGVWNKPIIVSECSVNRAASPEFRAKVYAKTAQKLSQIPGVQGVFWYISHWNAPPAEQANAESWYGTNLANLYQQQIAI